ncbi:hypothetical protein ACLOJK_029954 [Asimina triloba]
MGRIIAAGIVAMLAVPLSILVNRVVPEPYMDEIFHIPQAQQYCRGNFRSWDPMITTPPGLYYLSLVYIGSLFPGTQLTMAMSSFYDLCSVAVLRSANVVLAVMCSIIIYDIVICLRPSLGERRATIYTVVLSTYPLHWFFTFLYYTDVASTTAVLSMYLACLKRYYWFSALLGALAIFIRQTNVIWMLFVACTGAIKYAEVLTRKDDEQAGGHVKSIKENDALVESKGMPVLSNLRKRKTADSYLSNSISREIAGAKDAHAVSLHFAQIMYFGLVSAAAMAPVVISTVFTVHFQSICLVSIAFSAVLICPNSVFLKTNEGSGVRIPRLEDPNALISLVPGKTQKKLWILAFFLACAAVLVPAPLVEFRYYTIPFYFVILHSQVEDSTTWSLIWASYTAINAFTMTTFLFRPFEWSHEPGIQRYMLVESNPYKQTHARRYFAMAIYQQTQVLMSFANLFQRQVRSLLL